VSFEDGTRPRNPLLQSVTAALRRERHHADEDERARAAGDEEEEGDAPDESGHRRGAPLEHIARVEPRVEGRRGDPRPGRRKRDEGNDGRARRTRRGLLPDNACDGREGLEQARRHRGKPEALAQGRKANP